MIFIYLFYFTVSLPNDIPYLDFQMETVICFLNQHDEIYIAFFQDFYLEVLPNRPDGENAVLRS